MIGPSLHDFASLFEQVGTLVGGLYPTPDNVAQRLFGNLPPNLGLCGPGSEAGPEAVRSPWKT